ncbi:hypothetical protein Kole_0068 [Kosmotoga olearia TBF 19.5.1]|uniref:Uncharacterized protein n=1 Tax=Kosmotoga olearia (strain ATCC BAA-1733 / DSM 21960 / TBF 19.5.1) TaxID=521045 RepID=C5CHU1_KOSOT|nr:hypothetical protein Kole_0068 [Kosmotoga olearia TBF 19.5.1]
MPENCMCFFSLGFLIYTIGPQKKSLSPIFSILHPESTSRPIGHITLGTKQTGKPYAGKPHVRFDVAGDGNLGTAILVRHSRRKRGETG